MGRRADCSFGGQHTSWGGEIIGGDGQGVEREAFGVTVDVGAEACGENGIDLR